MNIVCATDDNYVPLCGIMLTSLLENNRGSHVDIYISLIPQHYNLTLFISS